MAQTQVVEQIQASNQSLEQKGPRKSKADTGFGSQCGVFALSAMYMGVGALSLLKESLLHGVRRKKIEVEDKNSTFNDEKSAGPEIVGRCKIPMLPIDNFRHLDEDSILEQLPGLKRVELEIVKAYETENARRPLILNTIKTLLAG